MPTQSVSRRKFLKQSLIGASAISLSACAGDFVSESSPAGVTSHKKPNILFILADDIGCWAMGCAGNREIITPNIDELAKTGIRFENFFCSSPVCSPARATLLTGRIPSQHGIHDYISSGSIDEEAANLPEEKRRGPDGNRIEYLKGFTAYTEILADHGYQCAHIGKWHLGDSLVPQKGNEHWVVMPYGSTRYKGDAIYNNGEWDLQDGYTTTRLTDYAVEFLREKRDPTRPFHLSLNYTAPHAPWYDESHPDYLKDQYKHCKFKSVPDLECHPDQKETVSSAYNDPEYRRQLLTGYFAAITGMDQQIKRVIQNLKESGEWENTLVIFSGDNGMNMGQHGIWGKGNATYPMNLYDESVKVPLIISGPLVQRAEKVNHNLLSQYDILPTLLDYVGCEFSSETPLPGTSFADLIRGKKIEAEERIFVYDEYGPVRMIRTDRWKYIHYYGGIGQDVLYDLKKDPHETKNIITNPKHSETLADLKTQLTEWFSTYTIPEFDGSDLPVTGKGQRNLIGPGYEDIESFIHS